MTAAALSTGGFRLPHAARALDVAAITARLQATLFADGPRLLRARPCYLRLKPGTALFVLWEVEFTAADAPSDAAAHDAQRSLQRDYVELSTGAGGLVPEERRKWETLHPSLAPRERFLDFDAAHDTILARLPFDLELRRLPRLLDPEGIKRVVETLPDPFGDGRAVAIRARGSSGALQSFRPRRRAVVRLELRGRDGEETVLRRAIAREFAAPPASGLAWRVGLAAGPWPRLLSASADQTFLLEELLPGAPWSGATPFPCAAAGEQLGRFHAATRAALPRFAVARMSWARELEAARQVVLDIAALAPELADLAERSWRTLPVDAPRSDDLVGVHGDLHAGQLLQDDAGQLTWCDLDRARPGAPAKDLGRLIADLEQRDALPTDGVAALLEGWASRSGCARLSADSLAPWIALAHLQAASEPLRRCRPDALTATVRALESAARHGQRAAPANAKGAS
ncbi:MAG: aminoglycoside phosphotransferase family protein [Planctomycetes bacterium]|nr:aminoglycoside phosphotransferase family protein [Planctomycetota bacterium]